MIDMRDYEEMLRRLAQEYFVFDLKYADETSAGREAGSAVPEPYQTMKIVPEVGNKLTLFLPGELDEEVLNGIVNGLSVRWSVRDNVSDPAERLDTIAKRLAYCFLKTYAKTVSGVGGDDLIEDDWAIKAMEKLDFFSK
ncbi:MAG TPA: hypothetical protein VLD40_03125 [Dissulfurispiraceae bacterium]|nr:hypothetical protein [Dissulfurispiraceae bacterium]